MSNLEQENEKIRHSTAHILAAAVLKIFPQAKYAVGPAIKEGFYYDFELPSAISSKEIQKIEKEMKKIIQANLSFKKKKVPLKKALTFFKEKQQSYKLNLIKGLEKQGKKEVTFYELGSFTDLCSGPHIKSTREINPSSFKITKVSGAYWEGDENKKQLQRIYGVVFSDEKKMQKYLEAMQLAKERDHRKLGKELDLFVFSKLVGPGLPLFTPKGTLIIEKLREKIEAICRKHGYEKVMTPHLAKIDLFKISGHADKFKDELFHVTSKHKQDYVLKPVQCPHQIQIYGSRPRSYQDLPIRYMESEKQYRAEKPGEIGGLNRVIAITIEDGHSFCRLDQIKEEIKSIVKIIQKFYSSLGLWKNHWVSLSFRDYASPEKYIGEVKDWKKCEKILEEINKEMKLGAKKCIGEAALYGPKIDFMFRDATGKEIQIPTVQLDFATPKKFNLNYTDKTGKPATPIMVHRAILGSYERFLALLIEHFAGAFPVWLAPVQVMILPVSEKFISYAKKVEKEMIREGIRVKTNENDSSLGKKIAGSIQEKIPYALIVGEREEKKGRVSPRSYRKGNEKDVSIKNFIERIKKEITLNTL